MSDNDGCTVRVGWGCLPLVLLVFLGWALLFGVTWNGKHHGISCSRARGVEIK